MSSKKTWNEVNVDDYIYRLNVNNPGNWENFKVTAVNKEVFKELSRISIICKPPELKEAIIMSVAKCDITFVYDHYIYYTKKVDCLEMALMLLDIERDSLDDKLCKTFTEYQKLKCLLRKKSK